MQELLPVLRILIRRKIVPEGALQDKKLSTIKDIAERYELTEIEIASELASELQIDLARLGDKDNETDQKILNAKGAFGRLFLLERIIFPIEVTDSEIIIATANPFLDELSKRIEFEHDKRVVYQLSTESEILSAIREYYPRDEQHFDTIGEISVDQPVEYLTSSNADEEFNAEIPEAPPIIKLVNKILVDATESRASDIHLEPVPSGLEVRFRIDGVMQHILEIPNRIKPYVTSRVKLLAGMDVAEKRRPQDGRLRTRIGGEPVDMRVSSVPIASGEKIVLRILRSSQDDLNLSNLGMAPILATHFDHILQERGKMLLVTGPTGSGKTTTLYTALSILTDGTTNIATVEDPIEYRMKGVNQIQVNETIGVTFASALRSILRQDPDVIMIGEIRDKDTAIISMQAAQTGHLVLSTLHTNSAAATITRLMDLGVERHSIASNLGGVLSQRLVRILCPHCAEPHSDESLLKYTDIICHYKLEPSKLLSPKGCKKCNNTGYSGRVGIYSLLPIDEQISEMIYRGESTQQILKVAREGIYQDLHYAAADAVMSGKTSLEEAHRYLLTKSTPVDNEVQEIEQASIPQVEALQKPKILIVEDDDDVRSVLAMLLQKEMFEVAEAENGQDALNRVYQELPDVILLDLMMPVMDGKEFMVRLKGNQKTKDIPIVILTAVDNEEREIELIDLGANDFISKGSSSKVVLSRIRRLLS